MFRNTTYSNRPDRVAQLAENWASNSKIVGFIPAVIRHDEHQYQISFVETPRKFVVAKLSIRKLGPSYQH